MGALCSFGGKKLAATFRARANAPVLPLAVKVFAKPKFYSQFTFFNKIQKVYIIFPTPKRNFMFPSPIKIPPSAFVAVGPFSYFGSSVSEK